MKNAALLKALGYDYVELNLSALAAMDDAAFAACRASLEAAKLPAEAVNVFFPGEIRLTGPDVEDAVIAAYTEHALSRAEVLGIRVAVLGSSRSRNIPEGFDPDVAYRQFLHALRLCGGIAARHGVTIAIEPLHFPESNLINRVSDGLKAARDAAHPAVRTLADLWHMDCEAEDFFGDRTVCGGRSFICISPRPRARILPRTTERTTRRSVRRFRRAAMTRAFPLRERRTTWQPTRAALLLFSKRCKIRDGVAALSRRKNDTFSA